MPPNRVADLTWSGEGARTPAGPPMPRRLTLLMNGSSPDTSLLFRFQPLGVIVPRVPGPEISSILDYRAAMLGILASLLERLPGREVRLVVFDLDQQKEILRQDDFTLKDMGKAARAANDSEHWVVTVRELQEMLGRWGLLAKVLQREIHAPDRSDVVLFLGPKMAPIGNMPAHFLEDEKGAAERIYYLQYRLSMDAILYGVPLEMGTNRPDQFSSTPPPPPFTPEPLDPIESVMARVKGKTLVVHSPPDFGKAIDAIRRH